MTEEYQIVYKDEPEWDIIGSGINEYNLQHGGPEHGKSLCFVVQTPDQGIVGGVIGSTYWNWLHVDLMWLKEEFRHRGFGSRLLATAEEEARRRGAKNAYLDTFSFQALDFYKKYGYHVFGELPDFPAGHTRYFMTKAL